VRLLRGDLLANDGKPPAHCEQYTGNQEGAQGRHRSFNATSRVFLS
jgi:hypothetical protein